MSEGPGRVNESEGKSVVDEGERLLLALLEHLKSPLLQIARGAELGRIKKEPGRDQILDVIELTAQTALSLLDNYLLSRERATGQLALMREPIALSAVLHETAHQLEPLAKRYGCAIRVECSHSRPVMANRVGLQAAMNTLGQAFIEIGQAQDSRAARVITLGSHNTGEGIVGGVFANIDNLSTTIFKRAKALHGSSRAPLREVTSGSGAAIFVAESLFGAMEMPLHVAQHQHLRGLAATLLPSQQLKLV